MVPNKKAIFEVGFLFINWHDKNKSINLSLLNTGFHKNLLFIMNGTVHFTGQKYAKCKIDFEKTVSFETEINYFNQYDEPDFKNQKARPKTYTTEPIRGEL